MAKLEMIPGDDLNRFLQVQDAMTDSRCDSALERFESAYSHSELLKMTPDPAIRGAAVLKVAKNIGNFSGPPLYEIFDEISHEESRYTDTALPRFIKRIPSTRTRTQSVSTDLDPEPTSEDQSLDRLTKLFRRTKSFEPVVKPIEAPMSKYMEQERREMKKREKRDQEEAEVVDRELSEKTQAAANNEVEAASTGSKNKRHDKQTSKPDELDDSRLCKVCLEREINTIMLPCTHYIVCNECVLNIKQCPMCRMKITGTVKAYRR